MDRTRLLVIGIVALVLGAVLSSVVYQRLQAKMAPPKVGADVVVAAKDIQVGAKIGDLDLKVVKYPPEDLPPRVFRTKASESSGETCSVTTEAFCGSPVALRSVLWPVASTATFCKTVIV
jgi:Flp pilus assembly protein CpaB